MKTFKELRKEIDESVISEADKNDQYVNDPWLGTKPFWQKAKQKVAAVGQMIPGMNKPLKSQKPSVPVRSEPTTDAAKPQQSSIESRKQRAQELKQLGKERSTAKPAPVPSTTTPKPTPDPKTSVAKPTPVPKTSAAKPNIKPIPKPAPIPAKKSLPTSSPDMDDLRASAARMKSATSDMASKTGTLKSVLTPQTRMEKPISPGGQSSSQVRSAISKLGGEPAKPVGPEPKLSPTTPPRLSSSELKKNPSAGGGKWV